MKFHGTQLQLDQIQRFHHRLLISVGVDATACAHVMRWVLMLGIISLKARLVRWVWSQSVFVMSLVRLST